MKGNSAAASSLQVFRAYIKIGGCDNDDEDDSSSSLLDVSGIISRECYDAWLDNKFALDCEDEAKKFHRTLTNHVSGVDGRTPFTEDEEQALLAMFRRKTPWPCFAHHAAQLATLGTKSRAQGFHEKKLVKQRLRAAAASASPSSFSSPPSSSSMEPATRKPFMSFTPTLAPAASRLAPVPLQGYPAPPVPTSLLPPLFPPLLCAPVAAPAAVNPRAKLVDSNVSDILGQLPPAQAKYVKDFATDITKNFPACSLDSAQWKEIGVIFRFMAIANSFTPPAALASSLDDYEDEDIFAGLELPREWIVDDLCRKFDDIENASAMVMVVDLAAKEHKDRVLAQNRASEAEFGRLLLDDQPPVFDPSELFRVSLVLGAAFHLPGTCFTVQQQRLCSITGEVKLYDVNYYVDPSSFLLAVSSGGARV